MVSPTARRETALYLQHEHAISQRHACRLAALSRSAARYQSRSAPQSVLRKRLCELAAQRPRFGYRRLTVLLQREGHQVNHKRIYRLYRLEGLVVRRKPRKRVGSSQRPDQISAQKIGQLWSMDFLHDRLANGGRFRTLNVLDTYSRECLAIEVDRSLPSARVIDVLDRVIAEYGCPKYIRIDNGLEFVGQVLEQWAAQKNIQ